MNIQTGTFIAVLVGLISGLAIGAQGTINSITGKALGPISTGLWVNLLGGLLSGIIIVILMIGKHFINWGTLKPFLLLVTISGALGIGIIVGIAYSLPRIGVAAGLATIITGQMFVAIVVDKLGWGGGEQISITPARLLGLLLLLVGTWFLLPRK